MLFKQEFVGLPNFGSNLEMFESSEMSHNVSFLCISFCLGVSLGFSNSNLCTLPLVSHFTICLLSDHFIPFFRSTESINTAGFYNYGVPSNKPKQSTPIKRHRSTSELGPSRIQVCVRKRPLSQVELDADEEDVVTVTSSTAIELSVPKLAVDLTKYTQKV